MVVGISEQYDPQRPVVGGSSTSTLSEVQEPHHLGGPGPPQHYLPLQPRYSPCCLLNMSSLMIVTHIVITLKQYEAAIEGIARVSNCLYKSILNYYSRHFKHSGFPPSTCPHKLRLIAPTINQSAL